MCEDTANLCFSLEMEQASVLLPAHIDTFHLALGQEPGVMPNCLSLRPGENVGGRAQEVAGACKLDTGSLPVLPCRIPGVL